MKSVGYAVAERMDPKDLITAARMSLEQKLRIDYLRYFGGPDRSLDLFIEQLSLVESELEPVAGGTYL